MAKVLGIDFGNSRIGIALGEGGVSYPLKILNGKSLDEVLRNIKKVIEENRISFIVLGIPKNETIGVKRFKKVLEDEMGLPIRLLNEDFTSKEALEYSIKMGYSKKGRRYLDDVAACMILERHFDDDKKSAD